MKFCVYLQCDTWTKLWVMIQMWVQVLDQFLNVDITQKRLGFHFF